MEINKENITLILSVIATIISTMLALLRIQESRKNAKRKYEIKANVVQPFKNLEVNISNRGYRPITITGFEIYYGNDFIKKVFL